MKSIKFYLCLAAALACGHLSLSAQEDPQADERAVVVAGDARFTVLTPRMVRMEWSADGVFEDRATLTFVNRKLPVPEFKVRNTRSKLVITTADLTVTYTKTGKFTPENLKAEFMLGDEKVVWHYGDKDSLNLMGTTRTLDGTYGWKVGREPMEQGLVSRSGWSVVDDSSRHVLADIDSHWKKWVECRSDVDRQDVYLFAYGHDYMDAMGDYVKVAGRIPLPPKFAFGYWWSRYWQYSDNEMVDLVNTIKGFDIPIDVFIVDMDWHETWSLRSRKPQRDAYGQRTGWTGYTWNDKLFPSPENFLQWCHNQRMKTALNLHPASGIEPFEEPYERFAADYGWTEKGKGVPFHIDDPKWADSYFKTVLGPMEKQGVDFWWLDWQQWIESKYTKGLSNTFWLNHVFNQHMEEKGDERPLIYHRWGGLGSHRYQVGFSGDAYIAWETLGFLPWFTATASNVGYGYWGHDIGGHMYPKGVSTTDPEMYTRWLQYGVFTPIFKTHSTRDSNIERRIWRFPDYMMTMREAIRLRYDLAPYIYTAARQAFDTGVSMCRPMYYYWPEADEAYDYKEQYMFGDDIIATAVWHPVDKVTGLAQRTMWFPKGEWFDCATGAMIDGDKVYTLQYTIDENPYFARAGAIIPMNPSDIDNLQDPCDKLVLTVIPGGNGETSLYEDDGMAKDYADVYATTRITKAVDGNRIRVTIFPREGSYEGAPDSRRYEIRMPAHFPPVNVEVNGRKYEYSRFATDGEWGYDGYTLAPIVYVPAMPCSEACVVEFTFDDNAMNQQSRLYGKQGVFRRFVKLTNEFKEKFPGGYDAYTGDSSEYLYVSQSPNFIMEYPERIVEWLDRFDANRDLVVPSLQKVDSINPDFIERVKSQMEIE